ncbi:SbcC/MukB-like Walker B domain-containing protein [Pseudalkalibacillus berkeleyi]|uniref:Nuclease SbcCD subunit C n=1 Tax=Pseudalkalibacillus berkeleyi TaxID=1069813 RepID=A0ABS9GY78_9BACL|nr:SMC family ATPase [Pseudalkalibacillus berkeleyi]MCF6136771.1 SMC family ATPase [Pseudalkalibacillus berkeleyi]
MRPIHLSVAGLHSFREKQDVDFQTLCDGGVFGIFGPTGSGKSSLLDAVTLALYGKVERAANTIQGIMNHAEDQLNVSFTFELGEGTSAKRYKVDRTYKRGKNDAIRTSTCRLIEVINEEHVVMADKERDVTSEVEQILGLTLTDFTRAVVLPQGKFAEFLSLKGAERRQMLQRLFRLEQYGDLLNQRLKKRAEETNIFLKEIVAEQQGLGDASQELITELEKRLKETIENVKVKNQLLSKKEVQFEHYRQIWQWQEELNGVKERLHALAQQEPEVKKLAQQLEAAKVADALVPYVNELENILNEQQDWTYKRDQLTKKVEHSSEIANKTVEELKAIRKHRAEHEPKLYEQLQQLKQASDLDKERTLLRSRLKEDQLKLRKQKEELEHAETELINFREKKQKALKRQTEIKQKIESNTISIEDRNRLRDGITLKKEIESKQQSKDERQKEFKKLTQVVSQLDQTIEKQTREKDQLKKKMGYLLYHTETIFNRVCEHERVIETAKSGIESTLKDSIENQRKLELNSLSAQVAEHLDSGEACPVCGSIDHPKPATHSVENRDYREVIQDLEQTLTDIKNEEIAIKHSKKDLEYLFETIQEYVQKEELSGNEIAATSFDPIDQTMQTTEELKQYLHILQTETKGFKQDLIELKEKKNQYTKLYSACDKEWIESKTSQNTYSQELVKTNEKKVELEEQIQVLENRWNEQYHSMPYHDIEQLQSDMDKRDQELTDLNQRYDKSVSFLYELEDTITQCVDRVQTKKLSYSELNADIKSSEKRLQECTSLILERCGEENPDELIRSVQLEMDTLKRNEQAIQQTSESESAKLQTHEKDLEVAKSALEQVNKRLQVAQRQWDEKSVSTIFESREQVKDAIIPLEKQNVWEKRIQAFHNEKIQQEHDQSRLLKQLNNKEISEFEWQKVQSELSEAKQAKEKALSENARLDGEVEEVKKRAVKYNELEVKREEYEEVAERLGKLQAVFRGNSFVEFIAEEQLNQVARDASQRLGELTRQRYALEVDSTGGFVIRDDANGGVRRPVTSLSGGETFLTSLALALSLSAQIQLQGEYPLEFFFLDEGFGTLDQSLLDTVISALERLQMQQVSVGVISHVPELRARLPRKLIVEPATPSGKGSTVSIETL